MNLAPVLHTRTARLIDQFVKSPNHALLLVAPDGTGKTYLAKYIAAKVLHLPLEDLANYAYLLVISPDEKNIISVDVIREIQHQLRLKTVGKQRIRRVIIIEHSDCMTIEAQNAFLKMLEEPPEDTVYILTASSSRLLLPTIASRLQQMPISLPLEDEVTAFFSNRFQKQSVQQAYSLSGGQIGLMSAILEDDSTHPLVLGVQKAKELLAGSTSARLLMVNEVSADKQLQLSTVEALLRIAQTGLNQAVRAEDSIKVGRWQKVLKSAHAARQALSINGNSKLVITRLVLDI